MAAVLGASPRTPTPPGLVIREATETDLGRIVELLVLGAVTGAPAGVEDPAVLLNRFAGKLDALDGSALAGFLPHALLQAGF